MFFLSSPSGVVPAGSPPPAHQPPEKSVVMRPALAQTPIGAELPIATSSPFSSTHDFTPPLSLQCAGERPVAHQDGPVVPNYSPDLDMNSSPHCLPSSLQRNTFLTDTRPCNPDYSPPASPLHRRAPSENTIDLCFTLTKRRETPVLQNSPGK